MEDNRKDYKEIFNETYYESIENGDMPEVAAEKANEKMIDHFSNMADEYRDRLKYGDR